MPKEMALIFKTRDQLQALDLRLGLGKRSQDRLISLFCLKALENDELERAPSAWRKAQIATNYKVRRFVVRFKFWFIQMLARLKILSLPGQLTEAAHSPGP